MAESTGWWRRRSVKAGDAVGEPVGQDASGPPPYGELWNPGTVAEAAGVIYNTTDMTSFEDGGRGDAAFLSAFFGPDSVVLDLGCGIGRVAHYVAPGCRQLWAVDASPRMLELARQRLAEHPNVTYARCDDVSFGDVPSASVDLAYSLLVLQHVEREDAFLLLEELGRVLRAGGTAVLTFPNLLSDVYRQCFIDYAHQRASSQRNRARLYTAPEVECILEAAGFVDSRLEVGDEIRVTTHRP